MNSIELKKYLLDNPNQLEEILKSLDLKNIRYKGNEIICSRDKEGNGTSTHIKLNDNLTVNDYKRGINGDIFVLIQEIQQINFPQSIQYINNLFNFDATYVKYNKPVIFGGFFSTIKKHQEGFEDLKTYSLDLLDEYDKCGNERFLKEGISLETQQVFNIGYDWYTHRITIPEYSCDGELIGVMGRWNGENYNDLGISKYLPIIEFPKSQSLYGYHINYNFLVNNNIFAWESQKSVMKMYEQKVRNCVACECTNLSFAQIKYIQALNPKSVIVGFDEGITKEEVINQASKLIPKSGFLQYRVGILYDEYNEFLKAGSKDSPADLPIEKLREMTKKFVRWIN